MVINYFTSYVFNVECGDQKKMFKIVAKFPRTNNDTPLPPCDSFNTFAEQFSDLFSDKI